MKKLTIYTLLLVAFWLAVFFVNRAIFIIYQMPIGPKLKNSNEILRAFYKGQAVDFSVIAMFVLPVLLFATIYFFSGNNIMRKILKILMCCFLLLYVSVCLSDAGLYKEWNAKINMQALEHFKNPSEVFKTVHTQSLFLFVLLLFVIVVPFYFLYVKKIHPYAQIDVHTPLMKKIFLTILFFVCSNTAGIILLRGGIGDVSINQSYAYFSNETIANDMAVNPLYTLMQDIDINSKLPDTSMYKIVTNAEAQKAIAADYFVAKDTTISVLNTTRPNIVYLFLESWSADNVSTLGGIEGCTPQFNQLCNEGLLFTKAYSNAYVSDQGIVTGLSAYPAAHRMAIVNQPGKIVHLPCITEDLIPLGYSTSFLYGGDLIFGNLRGYLLEKKFDKLVESNQLTHLPSGKLGVHDEYTFPELLQQLNQSKSPFFQGFFTLSSHMPYDYEKVNDWNSAANDAEKSYTESVHYSDMHLGKFFEEAKKQSWYQNTLFVLVADHSHNSIKQWDAKSAMRQHIPLLFIGGAIKDEWKGKRWDKVVSQLDIVSTILHQMNLKSNHYPWSRNMLNPYTASAAFYVFYGGAGYVNEQGFAAVHYDNRDFVSSNIVDTANLQAYRTKALSFQQLVFENVRYRK